MPRPRRPSLSAPSLAVVLRPQSRLGRFQQLLIRRLVLARRVRRFIVEKLRRAPVNLVGGVVIAGAAIGAEVAASVLPVTYGEAAMQNGINKNECCFLNFNGHPGHLEKVVYVAGPLLGDEVYTYFLWINTNGILSFRTEFPNFLNLPFPLEYPAIAPFYSNVDTTLPNDTSLITYYQAHDTELLQKVSELIRNSFTDAIDFQADSLVVATWQRVGHFQFKNEETNTFQVAIICGSEETYVQFLYPSDALNWLQGDTGESGLPDIRAQAGFVSEDLRHYTLKGSGTDNVRHLPEFSNIDVPGSWLYRVGPLGHNDNVEEPDVYRLDEGTSEPPTCLAGGNQQCHSLATCSDHATGFSCACKSGYYGNGLSCVKNDAPLRVSGSIQGDIGGIPFQSQLQSYIVTADGRTYTAVTPLQPDVGAKLQLVQVIGGPIGWLFAKPIGNTLNGYQITGGTFTQTSTLRFQNGNEVFTVKQNYSGLNHWDQLAVDIHVTGELPDVPPGERLVIDDFTEEHVQDGNKITSLANIRIRIPSVNRDYPIGIYNEITFKPCDHLEEDVKNSLGVGILKTTRMTISYESRENALRIGGLNKIGNSNKINPCEDGTHNCGENTVCEPTGDYTFQCNCLRGFTYDTYQNSGYENCVDIDECAGEDSICSENADCVNEIGGFKCICHAGFEGNGFQCSHVTPRPHDPYYTTPRPVNGYEYSTERVSYTNECHTCDENADCVQGRCICRNGWSGNGQACQYNCGPEHVWNGEACEKISITEQYEIDPYCSDTGCTCPKGYKLVEYITETVCQLQDSDSESEADLDSCFDNDEICSPHATCQLDPHTRRGDCVCNPGYDGNGIDCFEKEISCVHDDDICDEHATCIYNTNLKRSTCVCDKGYEGDGKTCHPADECSSHEHCGINSYCDDGVCVCNEGYERDISDFCVRAGSCGGAYCAENAECRWNHIQKVSYCHCPEGFVGDGVRECKSIPPPCNVQNNCGLYASCLPSQREPGEYECICNPGYFGDGFVCILEQHCHNVPSLCDRNARCISTTSGWQCICEPGFLGNGSICNEIPKLETGFIFVSQGVAIVKIPFGSRQGRPVAMAQMAIGLDKDCAEGRIYWADISAKGIWSVKYDGTDRQAFVTDDILSPEGVAVDWVSRRIYWTDSTKDTIEVASLDNPRQRAVLINKHLVNPRGIAVDPHLNKIFWSDWDRNSPKIEWANLDGTERQILLDSNSVRLPNYLAFSRNAELCFSDAGNFKVECVDTYSKSVRTIAANLSYPFGLAVTDDEYYWTDWTTKKIEITDYYGTRKEGIPTPLFGSHKMYGVTAVNDKCSLFHSPCSINNGDCPPDRICLTNPRSPSGRSCKCVNSKTCNEAAADVQY